MQAFRELHDKLVRSVSCEPDGCSALCSAQVLPFQNSASALVVDVLWKATASHAFAEAHDTPLSPLCPPPPGTAPAWGFQPLPFQLSLIGTTCPRCRSSPTATQALAATQETPARKASLSPFGSGVVCTVQPLPFQCSAKARPDARATASHAVAEVHDTELNSRFDDLGGAGVCLILQLLPFHCSASKAIPPWEVT